MAAQQRGKILRSQSTIKMDKGYYHFDNLDALIVQLVAIHNKNGQGLLQSRQKRGGRRRFKVAIHNKNGQGLLHITKHSSVPAQVTVAIHNKNGQGLLLIRFSSTWIVTMNVAIHNKNGQGLLLAYGFQHGEIAPCRNPQ